MLFFSYQRVPTANLPGSYYMTSIEQIFRLDSVQQEGSVIPSNAKQLTHRYSEASTSAVNSFLQFHIQQRRRLSPFHKVFDASSRHATEEEAKRDLIHTEMGNLNHQ